MQGLADSLATDTSAEGERALDALADTLGPRLLARLAREQSLPVEGGEGAAALKKANSKAAGGRSKQGARGSRRSVDVREIAPH